MSILYFIIMVGALVFFHELGHFLVAKAFDVKVIRFSIGFGPQLIGFTRGETEYVICMLPLGGYVQMLGGDFSDLEALDEEEQSRALMSKPIWQRSLVILAGPVFNVILPIVIYFLFTLFQTTAAPAMVGEVFDETPAARAGLRPGDKIVAIDGEPVRYWHELLDKVMDAYDQELMVSYERDGQRAEVAVIPEKKTSTDFLGLDVKTYGMIGVHLGAYGPTLAITDTQGPAARAGLKHFDRVVTINGQPIKRYDEVEAAVRASKGNLLKFLVLRRVPIEVDYGVLYRQEVVEAEVMPAAIAGGWGIGADRAEMVIARVEAGSPVEAAGLRVGDQVVRVGDKATTSWSLMTSQIHNKLNEKLLARAPGDETPITLSFKVAYIRDGQPGEAELVPRVSKFEDQAKQPRYKLYTGWAHMQDTIMPDEVAFPIGDRLAWAGPYSVKQTWTHGKIMVMGLVRMIEGRVGTNSLGGPILIGELAAKAGEAGLQPFLQMMALISINLAVFNMVPIPVLDGGQLLLFMLEAIKRGPLSFRTRQIAMYIGFVMIVMVLLLAFKNDIERSWHRFVDSYVTQ